MSMYFPSLVFSPMTYVREHLSRLALSFSSNNAVEKPTFYIPPHLDPSALPVASLEKIKALRQQPSRTREVFTERVDIGIAAVRSVKDNSLVPVYFKVFKSDSSENPSQIKAYHLKTDQEIGSALLKKDEDLKKWYVTGPPDELTHYIQQESDQGPFFYLIHIENKHRDTYKNVGAVLFKAALQFYANYNCRLKLESVRENASLYCKLGCVVSENKNLSLQPQIEAAAKSKTKTTQQWGAIYMAISEAGRAHWKKEIQEHPIHFPHDV